MVQKSIAQLLLLTSESTLMLVSPSLLTPAISFSYKIPISEGCIYVDWVKLQLRILRSPVTSQHSLTVCHYAVYCGKVLTLLTL